MASSVSDALEVSLCKTIRRDHFDNIAYLEGALVELKAKNQRGELCDADVTSALKELKSTTHRKCLKDKASSSSS